MSVDRLTHSSRERSRSKPEGPTPSPEEIVSKGQDEKPNGERRMKNLERKKRKKTEKNSESPRFVFFILHSAFCVLHSVSQILLLRRSPRERGGRPLRGLIARATPITKGSGVPSSTVPAATVSTVCDVLRGRNTPCRWGDPAASVDIHGIRPQRWFLRKRENSTVRPCC